MQTFSNMLEELEDNNVIIDALSDYIVKLTDYLTSDSCIRLNSQFNGIARRIVNSHIDLAVAIYDDMVLSSKGVVDCNHIPIRSRITRLEEYPTRLKMDNNRLVMELRDTKSELDVPTICSYCDLLLILKGDVKSNLLQKLRNRYHLLSLSTKVLENIKWSDLLLLEKVKHADHPNPKYKRFIDEIGTSSSLPDVVLQELGVVLLS